MYDNLKLIGSGENAEEKWIVKFAVVAIFLRSYRRFF